VEPIGFYADIISDAISLENCVDREEAYSVVEALRLGAAEVLDMEVEDLQLLAIGQPGGRGLSLLLYDPMPGGSGLLDQMKDRWPEVVRAAKRIVAECPSLCASACVDCLLHYRNSYYHPHLNRHTALERLEKWGDSIEFGHDIPPRLPTPVDEEVPVNDPELALRAMLERAGMHGFRAQYEIDLGRPLGITTPDFFYEPRNDTYEGLCIYHDGMAGHLHGRAERREKDRDLRDELRHKGYEVIEIPHGHLTDPAAMRQHFFRIGRFLLGKEAAQRIRDDSSWYKSPEHTSDTPPKDLWAETLGLLDAVWHPLAQGLRLTGFRAPDEVDWDWIEGGRVSGKRALMMWSTSNGPIVLVDVAAGITAGPNVVMAEPNSVAPAIAALLRPLLEPV